MGRTWGALLRRAAAPRRPTGGVLGVLKRVVLKRGVLKRGVLKAWC